MNCLHCGDCCLRMSPLSDGPCPHIIEKQGFFFCSEYASRPNQCRNHKFPFKHCPIGIEKLRLKDPIAISLRIDEGWEISKSL